MNQHNELASWIIAISLALLIYRFSYRWVFRKHWGRFNPKRAWTLMASIGIITLMLAIDLPETAYLFLFFALCAFGAGAIKKRDIFL